MQHQRLAPPAPKPRRAAPKTANHAASWWLLATMLSFCAVAGGIILWGNYASAAPSAPASPVPTAIAQANAPVEQLTTLTTVAPSPAPATTSPYNPDPIGTLVTVLEQDGEGLFLIGGSLLGGIIFLLVAAKRMTRIPADPLAVGLARTLTLLENNHRAGHLTPQRALEVARQTAAEMQSDYDATSRARTQEYEQAVARLNQDHATAVAAIRNEATDAVKVAQADASRATARAEAATQRAANADVHVAQLSRDLATAHTQLVEAHETSRTQAAEIAVIHQTMTEAANTLEQWQDAHRTLSARHTTLSEQHAEIQRTVRLAQTAAADATRRANTAEAEATALRDQHTTLAQEKSALVEQLRVAEKELSRLRGVSLRELPITIPDRESDLAPHLASIVAFIRGTTLDSGAANGERTVKPVLSSWRDIRRLLQVLKGVGLRFAVPAHHVPQWAKSEEKQAKVTTYQDDTEIEGDTEGATISSDVPTALTELNVLAHNGGTLTDLNTSEADVLHPELT